MRRKDCSAMLCESNCTLFMKEWYPNARGITRKQEGTDNRSSIMRRVNKKSIKNQSKGHQDMRYSKERRQIMARNH